MTRDQYLNKRNTLLDAAQKLIDEGKLEEAKAKQAEVEELDKQFDAAATAAANLAALRGNTRIVDVSGGIAGAQPVSIANLDAPVADIRDTKIYHDAWLKNMLGRQLTADERQALSNTAVPGPIPTQTANEIVSKIVQKAPLLNEITLLRIMGNVNFEVEGNNADATIHTPKGLITAAEDTTVTVSLGGYEFVKLVTISATVKTMAIDAYEAWLTDALAEKLALAIEYYTIKGSGNGQPTGVDSITFVDTQNAVQFASTNPTYAELCELVSYLKGGYAANAKWLMNSKTFWGKLQAIRDDGKAPIVFKDGNIYRVLGFPVLFSDKVDDGDMFLGAWKKIVGNLSQDMTVESSAASGFRYNAVDYRGVAIYDCDVAIDEAFVKGANAL